MYKTFPKVSEILSKDLSNPAMGLAVVLDNKLIATNGMVLIMLNTCSLVDSEEQEQNLSGKVFSRDLLILLQKAKRLIFLKDKISVDGELMEYSGTIDTDRKIYLGGSIHHDFYYVDYSAFIPKNPTELESIRFDPKLLGKILDCFSSTFVGIKFFGKSRAMMVYNPIDSNQEALFMPVTGNL